MITDNPDNLDSPDNPHDDNPYDNPNRSRALAGVSDHVITCIRGTRVSRSSIPQMNAFLKLHSSKP